VDEALPVAVVDLDHRLGRGVACDDLDPGDGPAVGVGAALAAAEGERSERARGPRRERRAARGEQRRKLLPVVALEVDRIVADPGAGGQRLSSRRSR
jgi:hypothetical protein